MHSVPLLLKPSNYTFCLPRLLFLSQRGWQVCVRREGITSWLKDTQGVQALRSKPTRELLMIFSLVAQVSLTMRTKMRRYPHNQLCSHEIHLTQSLPTLTIPQTVSRLYSHLLVLWDLIVYEASLMRKADQTHRLKLVGSRVSPPQPSTSRFKSPVLRATSTGSDSDSTNTSSPSCSTVKH